MKKKCCTCKTIKPIDAFSKNQPVCKECRKEYYQKNKKRINEKNMQRYYDKNPKKIPEPEGYKRCSVCNESLSVQEFGKNSRSKDGLRSSCKKCRQKEYLKRVGKTELEREPVPDGMTQKEYNQRYYRKNKQRIAKQVKSYHYRRLKNDTAYRLLQRCRTRLYKAIKGQSKSDSTINLIGCSPEQLANHLESQFDKGMTWDNYGEWHIDHIKPCSIFDFSKEEEQRECFHYTNLQPLWAEDNFAKSDKYHEADWR